MANKTDDFDDSSLRFGSLLANPAPGEEIVISGVSGIFPLAENIDEFKEKLYRKESMISKVQSEHPDMPDGFGLLKDKTRFDAGYFGIHRKFAQLFSPIAKAVLEKSQECILDAGLNPSDIEGTNTGLFLGVCFNEFEFYYYLMENVDGKNPILGNERSAIANSISYALKLNGPCMVLDTACSSGGFALEAAYKAIRLGQCDAAVVAASNFLLSEEFSLQFSRLGVLSPTGECRPFDDGGLGYVRSEATVVMLLQKAKDANRVYATIVHSKTNCDGFKEQGITYPNGAVQFDLVKEIYLESNIPPHEVSYIEAHGTGTIVGDPEELNSIDKLFTPNRKQPLLVGSCKSSIGHSEPTSMLCSIVKVILAYELDLISPNINYETPRKGLKGVHAGRIKIVVDPTPFQDENGLVGINSFGFGGGNVHAILKRNKKLKINNGKPTDELPRLVCVSGRTEEGVHVLLDCISSNFDVEQIALIYSAFRKPINNQLYRGYVIVSQNGVLSKSVTPYKSRKNLTLHFGALTRSSGQLLRELLNLQALKQFKDRTEQFFNKKKVNMDSAMAHPQFFTDLLVQLALAEMLRKLEVVFQTVLAQSVGRFIAAYFQNLLTLEQVLECGFVVASYLENGAKVQNYYRFKKDNLEQKKNHIMSEFKEILHPAKTTNGYGNNHKETLNQEDLFKALLESPGAVKTRSVLVEVGQTTVPSKTRCNLNLTNATGLLQILESLGSLYEYGQQPQIQRLYPQIEFPVSKGTPMICSAIKWKHDKKYFMPTFGAKPKESIAKTIQIDLYEEKWASLDGHVIDGRILFPATSYILLAWTAFSNQTGVELEKSKVIVENCRFLRACQLTTTSKLHLNVIIQMCSGRFEITENDVVVMTGFIRENSSSPKELNADSGICNGFGDDCMNSRDIYKELRLRGYNYKDKFKSLIKTNQTATQGMIKWVDDWVAFMDNMLQIQILGEDTRALYVPTFIERLNIDPETHLHEVNKLRGFVEKNENVENPPVNMHITVNRAAKIIRAGGIEFKGLKASSIPRKKTTALPVLEKYHFVPNIGKLRIEVALRVFMQIALENNCGLKVTAVEIVDDVSKDDTPLIGPIISEVLGDQPLVHSDVTILSSKNIECDVKVENKTLKEFSDITVTVGTELLNRPSVLDEAVRKTKEDGYIISRELISLDASKVDLSDLELWNIYDTDTEKLLFLRKKSGKPQKERVFVNINSDDPNFDWLDELKAQVMKKDQDVVVWCQDEPLNGLIGLVNCIRKEPECQHVRGLFIVGKAPKFDCSSPFYQRQLDKNLDVNVLMNGTWGTYRHLLLEDIKEVESEHCYANNTVRGDLSSIKWIEGPLTKQTQPLSDLMEVYYSSLNFKDVMIASGRINLDADITHDRKEQWCPLGFEFSGKTLSGKRVMGMLSRGTLATLVKADPTMLWNVPDSWTLQEAASVPVVYATCLYALVVVGGIKKGESILIHSGTGGIGQAAINLCLNMGCTIFTTVGTEEKREFIKKNFPQVNEKHIGNSRDLNFEQIIMQQTKGRGVDLVLNSLAEEKLFASVRCLSKNGRFLEIGKFDLLNHNSLDLLAFKRGGNYHGIMLDQVFNEADEIKMRLNRLVQKYIDSGAVKPLPTTVFKQNNELEQAFRFMTTGRHMGKVLVEVRNEKTTANPVKFKGIPRYYCDPSKTYVICGGLGGFGLELADWLILRGCRKLVLSSRKGITTGYQRYRINIWESYGCTIKISTQDITTKSGCKALIQESNALAPVAAIFNLAVVLMDAILSNQTKDSFQTSFKPKAYATQYLDEISRISCPELRDFVVFSSVSCGRGNAGQTNYGMSNSVMERICEKRRNDGYPGLAIQWGAVGDVGLVADLREDHIELEIGGTLQQSIISCLQVLDQLLRQNEAAVVSSIVVAEKKVPNSFGNIVEVIGGILGIRDVKSVSMHATLAELGMDSMNAVEVKQTLEREYNIILSPNEIRSLTLERVTSLLKEDLKNDSPVNTVDWTNIIKALLDTEEQTSSCITLKSNLKNSKNPPKVIAFPGIEGVCFLMEKLTANLDVQAFGINYISSLQEASFPKMAERLLPDIRKLLKPNESFHIIAHSLGCGVALEVVKHLESLGHQGKIILIDGSPVFVKELNRQISAVSLEDFLLANTLRIQLGEEETLKVMADICKCSTLDDKLKILVSNIKLTGKMTESFVINSVTASLNRAKACDYTTTITDKLKSKVCLYKPKLPTLKLDGDYELGQYFEHPVEVKTFEGNHTSILENKEMAEEIMRHFDVSRSS